MENIGSGAVHVCTQARPKPKEHMGHIRPRSIIQEEKEEENMAKGKGVKPKVKGEKGQAHVAKVMRMFYKGKLKDSAGTKVTNVRKAKAIAMSEARAGQKRGFTKRASATEKGRTRVRPKLTKRGKARAKKKGR